jgi:hypothetical protein
LGCIDYGDDGADVAGKPERDREPSSNTTMIKRT